MTTLQKDKPRAAGMVESAEVSGAVTDVAAPALEVEFRRLADLWRAETSLCSSPSVKASHPAYLRIIGMGRSALPFIYRELERGDGHWFAALRAITGANPVKPDDAGNIRKMKQAWLEYLRQNESIPEASTGDSAEAAAAKSVQVRRQEQGNR